MRPTTGGAVTGYRLWRQTGAAPFTVLGPDLAAPDLTYVDTAVTAATVYQYRLQALAAVGPGARTAGPGRDHRPGPAGAGPAQGGHGAAHGGQSNAGGVAGRPGGRPGHGATGIERSGDVNPRVVDGGGGRPRAAWP